MFVLLAIEFILAWTMPSLRKAVTLPSLVSLHFTLGILIFILLLFRIYWRATHEVPAPPSEMTPTARFFAHAMHYSLYFILIVSPFLGVAYASSHGWAVSFFGIFDLPVLFAKGDAFGKMLGKLHGTVATLFLFLVGFHTVAAYYHHLIVKDDILTRMLPEKKAAQ